MKIFQTFFIFCIALGLLSCNSNQVYKEYNKDFSTLQWEKDKKLTFTPDIKEIQGDYKLYLAFRHVYGFQFPEMSVKISETTPGGVTSSKEYKVKVIDESNEYLSQCAGDICDLESVIELNKKFDEAGMYTYVIEHLMPVDPLPNVMEVGLVIEKNAK